jgi:DMSO/TMAO reductase YedYZ heme-binding membrane subunit
VIFTLAHVAGLMIDTYIGFSLRDVLVPFATHWHPLAVAWGIVAFYLLLAVELTSLAKNRLSHKTWRRIHQASVPVFVLATVHTLTAGSDAGHPAALFLTLTACALVAVLGVYRVVIGRRPRPPRARTGGARRQPTSHAEVTTCSPSRPVPRLQHAFCSEIVGWLERRFTTTDAA